jgi:hypothetical protein
MHVADEEKHCLNKAQNAHFCLTMSTLHAPVRFKRCMFCGFLAWSSAPHAWYYIDVVSYECGVRENRLIRDSRFRTVFLLPVICSQTVCRHCVSCVSNFVSWILLKLSFKTENILLNLRCAENFPNLYFFLRKILKKNTRLPAYFAKV